MKCNSRWIWCLVLVLFAVGTTGLCQEEGGEPEARKNNRRRFPRAGDGGSRGPMGRPMGPGPRGIDVALGRLLHNPRIAEEIGLTDEQKEQLKQASDTVSPEMKRLSEQLQQAGEAQSEMLLDADVDEGALMAQVEIAGEITTRMAKLRIKQILAVKKILTAEQRAKLEGMMKRRAERFRRGPGGARGEGKPRRDGPRGDPPPEGPPPDGPPPENPAPEPPAE